MGEEFSSNPRNLYDQRGQNVFGYQVNIGGNVEGNLNVQLPQLEPRRAVPPAPPIDFVGRTAQLAQLAAMLTAERSAAIIAIHGMGGIGKTALVIQLATQVNLHFPGGIFWGGLEEHSGSAETILRAWGDYCGVHLSQEPNPAVLSDRVRGLLTMRRESQGSLLAILDDVREEWIETAKLLKKSLPADTSLLLTMRDIDLATSLDADVVHLDVLSEESAHELLVARVKPKEILQPETAVQLLLKHLGYLPLAIRLAVSHINNRARKPGFDMNQFVKDISSLGMSVIDTPDRSGLAAIFAISYEALNAKQQRVFRYCSVYSAMLLTLEHMSSLIGMEPNAVETTMDELVDYSLLDWHHEQKGRYLLHPLLRQYGYDKLHRQEEVTTVHKLAAIALEKTLSEREGTPDELLETIIQWRKAEQWEIIAQRASVLMNKLARIGYWKEMEEQFVSANQMFKRDVSNRDIATSLVENLGLLYKKQGQWGIALTYLESSLLGYREIGDRRMEARVLNELGYIHRRNRQFAKAKESYDLSLAIFQEIGDSDGQGRALCGLGVVFLREGNLEGAVDNLQESLAILKSLDRSTAVNETLNNLGRVYHQLNRWEDAIAVYDESIRGYQELGDLSNTASTFNKLSKLYIDQGQWTEAANKLGESLTIYRTINDRWGEGKTLNYLGRLFQKQHLWDQARNHYKASLSIFRELGDIYYEGKTLFYLGGVYEIQEGPEAAISIWKEALAKLHPKSTRYSMLAAKVAGLDTQMENETN